MKAIIISSERRWTGCFIPKGTKTKKEFVAALTDLPDDLPIVFSYGGYYWGLHENPSVSNVEVL